MVNNTAEEKIRIYSIQTVFTIKNDASNTNSSLFDTKYGEVITDIHLVNSTFSILLLCIFTIETLIASQRNIDLTFQSYYPVLFH